MRRESMPHSKVNQNSETSFYEAKFDPSPSVRPTDKPPNTKKKMSRSHRCWSWFHLTITVPDFRSKNHPCRLEEEILLKSLNLAMR